MGCPRHYLPEISCRRLLLSVTFPQVRIADRVIYTTLTREATRHDASLESEADRRDIMREKVCSRDKRAESRKDLIIAAAAAAHDDAVADP